MSLEESPVLAGMREPGSELVFAGVNSDEELEYQTVRRARPASLKEKADVWIMNFFYYEELMDEMTPFLFLFMFVSFTALVSSSSVLYWIWMTYNYVM